jgi:hypothetical protein
LFVTGPPTGGLDPPGCLGARSSCGTSLAGGLPTGREDGATGGAYPCVGTPLGGSLGAGPFVAGSFGAGLFVGGPFGALGAGLLCGRYVVAGPAGGLLSVGGYCKD